MHVLTPHHGFVQVKVFDIDCREVCVECQDYDVEDKLHYGQSHCGCATISWLFYSFTPHGELCEVGVAL